MPRGAPPVRASQASPPGRPDVCPSVFGGRPIRSCGSVPEVVPFFPVAAQSIPPLILAGITFYLGVYNILIFARRPHSREYLSFAACCLFMGIYDVLCALLYNSSSTAQGVVWQRMQGAALALVCVAFSWFVVDYLAQSAVFHRWSRLVLAPVSALFLVIAVACPINPLGLFWNDVQPLVKTMRLPLGMTVVYNEVAPGVLSNVQSALGFALYAYLFAFVLRAFRAGVGRRSAGSLLAAMVLFFLAMVNDTAVSLGAYPFVYTMEYAYLGMVLLVTNSLTVKVVQVSVAQEALKESEDRFRGLVETSSDWIWEVDAEGVYTYASPKVYDLLGYQPHEVVGKSVFHFLAPSEARQVERLFRALAAARSPIERLENTNLRKDGRVVVLETSGIPVLDASGELIGYRGIDRDITQRRLVEEDLRGRTRQMEALRQLGLELTAELDLESLLKSVVSRAVALLGGGSGGIYIYDRDRKIIEWRIGVGPADPPAGGSLQLGEGLPGMVWQRNESLYANDFSERGGVMEGTASVGSPVRWGEEFFGVLCVVSDTSRPFDSKDAKLLEMFASQAAIALRNARLYEAANSRAERLAVVNRIAMAVGTVLELDELLEAVYRETARIFAPDSFFIALCDDRGGELDLRFRVDGGVRVPSHKAPVSDGFSSRILLEKKPLLVRDMFAEESGKAAGRRIGGRYLRSWLGAPMLISDRVIGIISIQSFKMGAYAKDDEQLLSIIAEQVAAAVERARLYETLRDSEERYRTLFEQAGDAVILQTADGRILDVNARACLLLGYAHDELLRLSITDIAPLGSSGIPPSSLEEGGTLRSECEYMRKDGSRVPVEVSQALMHVAGRPVVFGLVHDITQRKRMEEQLRQAQKMEAIGTLAGGIAHDFNNLLTGILGYASLLQEELPKGSSASADMEAIAGSARRAAELTQQLLTFSRRNPQVEMVPVGPNEVVKEVAHLLERTIDKSITVDTRLDPRAAAVMGNGGQLHQALLNLCLNARDAMPNGGLLRIETCLGGSGARVSAGGSRVFIRVSDTGKGMDAAVRMRLFEPFFTTKEKGRGLGLAMVYGIVRGHGGEISVHSDPGKGSTFEISLPASRVRVDEAGVDGGNPPQGGHGTVLIVDDEEQVRNVLKRMLERGGYVVVIAENGVRGVEAYRERRREIDLVILDMAMPRMSGTEAFESLLAMDPHVTVLLSSGYSEEGDAARLIERGAKGFLRKPYSIDMVLTTVREVLAKRRGGDGGS